MRHVASDPEPAAGRAPLATTEAESGPSLLCVRAHGSLQRWAVSFSLATLTLASRVRAQAATLAGRPQMPLAYRNFKKLALLKTSPKR